jgi:hypothetical protein
MNTVLDNIEDSMYHRVLRVASVVVAIVLVFESGIISHSTTLLAMNTHWYMANAVGMSASVDPNELNVLTAELTKQKKDLDGREAALREREIQVNLSNGTANNDKATYVLASILFILLILIIINYALDYLRAREKTILNLQKTV